VLDELSVDVGRLTDLAAQLLVLGSNRPDGSETTELNRAVATIVDRRRLADPDQADQLSIELSPEPVPAAIDPHSLERVVTNLVENAFTHGLTPVRVRVSGVEGASPTEHWAVVEVEDAGHGIEPELLEAATQRFTRAPDARSRPGAGLGLALVEQIVVALGGELRLCSRGMHVSHGTPTPYVCVHVDLMTATVIIPADQA